MVRGRGCDTQVNERYINELKHMMTKKSLN